jgi:hypothetical protein
MEGHKRYWCTNPRMLDPRLWGVYPGISLTTEEKAQKTLSQGSCMCECMDWVVGWILRRSLLCSTSCLWLLKSSQYDWSVAVDCFCELHVRRSVYMLTADLKRLQVVRHGWLYPPHWRVTAGWAQSRSDYSDPPPCNTIPFKLRHYIKYKLFDLWL